MMWFQNILNRMGKRNKGKGEAMASSEEASLKTLRIECEASPVLRPYLKAGLGAFANNERKKIRVPSTSLLECSVNLDEAAKASYPHENRWDYALGYSGQTYFIEIHPANTSEIDCVVKKVIFVKKWLGSVSPGLLDGSGSEFFYWVSSGTTDLRIMKNSPQGRRLALHKIVSVGQTWDYAKVSK